MGDQIYVAKKTFTTSVEGRQVVVRADRTRVREGHPLLEGREHLFAPLDVQYDIEQATAAPGEQRQANPTGDGGSGDNGGNSDGPTENSEDESPKKSKGGKPKGKKSGS